MSAEGRRTAASWALVIGVCVAAALGALLWVGARTRPPADGDAVTGTMADRPGGAGAEAEARASAPKRFLTDLEKLGSARAGESVAVRWETEDGLVKAGSEVLEAYRDGGTATLASSVYVDMKGNVWMAVVRDARGWVDIVSVTAGADDAFGEVRVVRMFPKRTQDE